MPIATEESIKTSRHGIDKLFREFLAHDATLDVLCRRIQCVGSGPEADVRIKQLEDDAGSEIDAIARVALRLSKCPAQDVAHAKIKAEVLWSLIKEEEPESISEVLLHSLCRDLLDD